MKTRRMTGLEKREAVTLPSRPIRRLPSRPIRRAIGPNPVPSQTNQRDGREAPRDSRVHRTRAGSVGAVPNKAVGGLPCSSSPLPCRLPTPRCKPLPSDPGDIVLEPSAGTGMLAVMAECALGKRTDDARSGDPLHLNEIAAVRAGLLAGLFQDAPVTRHNAEFHRRLSAGPASHCGVDEPAVFGEPRGPAHPP